MATGGFSTFEKLKILQNPESNSSKKLLSINENGEVENWGEENLNSIISEYINNPDGFVVLGTLEKELDNITIGENYKWNIFQQEYSNPSEYNFEIELEPDGYNRKAIIVANQSNGFEIIYGDSSMGANTAIQPPTPIGKLFLTVIDIFGDIVDEPSEPINGALYVEKAYYSTVKHTGTGVLGTLINGTKIGIIEFDGATTFFGGLTKNSQNYIIGQRFGIYNNQDIELEIADSHAPSQWKFIFPDGQNYKAKPGEFVPFVAVDFGVFKFVGRKSDTVGNCVFTKNLNIGTPVTGTTAEVFLDSFLIPANTINAGNYAQLKIWLTKTGVVNSNFSPCVYIGPASGISGTKLMTGRLSSTNKFSVNSRNIVFNSNTARCLQQNLVYVTDEVEGSQVFSNTGIIDYTIDNYINITSTCSNASETCVIEAVSLTIFK